MFFYNILLRLSLLLLYYNTMDEEGLGDHVG